MAAADGVLGDRDGIVDSNERVGLEDAFGIVDCEPIGDFGIFGDGAEVGNVVGADDTVGASGDFVVERLGRAGVENIELTSVRLSWVELGLLGGRRNSEMSLWRN